VVTNREIEEFLVGFRDIIDRSGLNLWETVKNNDFQVESGFTNADIEQIVRTLKPEHYQNGPVEDDKPHRPSGEVWIFGREYEGFELYIKLKKTHDSQLLAECMSAHEAEFPLKNPNRR